MSNKLKITIRIAGKVFKPLIDLKNEETVRKAAKMLDDKYTEYKAQIEDPFDCLALAALQTSIILMNKEKSADLSLFENKISEIDALLTDYLAEKKK